MSTYVYGIIRQDPSLDPSELVGVGDPPARVRLIDEGDLIAAVSTAPEGLLPKRRDLTAHQDVLMSLGERGPVLPMRFGTLAPDDGAVASRLQDGGPHYAGLLDRLEGRCEFNVKAFHVEEEALRSVLGQDPGLRAANDRLKAMGGGDTADRMAFGERVALALEELRRHHASIIVPALTAVAEDAVVGPAVEGCSANVSLLVRRHEAGELRQEVEGLRQSMGRLMDFHLNGPLPPYSFVGRTEEQRR